MTHVYVILNTVARTFKVGISNDPHSRFRTLQGGHCQPLTLLHTEPFPDRSAAQQAEVAIHHALRPFRCQGGREWFDLDGMWSMTAPPEWWSKLKPDRLPLKPPADAEADAAQARADAAAAQARADAAAAHVRVCRRQARTDAVAAQARADAIDHAFNRRHLAARPSADAIERWSKVKANRQAPPLIQ